jgi:ABC-type amino acid transport substrate-binding protein
MRIAKTKIALALGVLALTAQVQADQLADIKAAGVVKVATFDANPPFGSVDPKTHQLVGYDVDFAQALAKSLGVKLELVATNPANRIPLLQSGKADLIVADITITPERAQVIDFRHRILLPASSSSSRSNLPIGSTAIAKRGSARLKAPPANRRCISVSRSLACSPMTIFRWR